MRTWTETCREGTDVGPVDWDHPAIAESRIPLETLKAIEANPAGWRANNHSEFLRPVLAFRMYDGWPYWEPRPALLTEGPLGAEWLWLDIWTRVAPARPSTPPTPERKP